MTRQAPRHTLQNEHAKNRVGRKREGAPLLVPWIGKGRLGTGVFAWCLREFTVAGIEPNFLGPVEVIRSNPRDSVY